MSPRVKRIVAAAVIAVFGLQVSSCGYILHPERKGQKGGRIDPAIAVLDGVGLLLFLIPGIVAFIVDFHYGTIYLPGGKSAEAGGDESAPLKTVKFEGELTPERLKAVIAKETGEKVDLDEAQMRLARAASSEEIHEVLKTAEAGG
ncbi:MAG: hypothetical protein ACOC91_00170 [bacterium]